MIESALSPPYDGSEFEELFPELTGVEPEEMVDIEELADQALDSITLLDDADLPQLPVMPVASPSCDKSSVYSVDTNSDLGSVYDPSYSESDVEEEEDEDQLLRYLIPKTGQKKKRSNGRRVTNPTENVLKSRKYTKKCASLVKEGEPLTTLTVIDKSGCEKSVQGPNRNAVMAKLNRERKKQQMSELEEKVSLMSTENDALKKQNTFLRKKTSALVRELQYVKGVLANQSALSSLLQNIQATSLDFHTSMPITSLCKQGESNSNNKRKRPSDHDYCLEGPLNKILKVERLSGDEKDFSDEKLPVVALPSASASKNAGVCLHVSGGSVSLEFCSKCSEKAHHARHASSSRGNEGV